jgi:hypothetical protein
MAYYSPDTLRLLRTALDEAWELLPDYRNPNFKSPPSHSAF